MSAIDLPIVQEWLGQFDIPDRYLAEHIVRKLRYVSFSEVETWLQESLMRLLADIEHATGKKEAIAVFPVAKPFIHRFNEKKEAKNPADSSGRLAHAIKNLERRLPDHIELFPRIESMRDRKVRHIIFVDDFVGTGDRFIKSWRETVSPSIKAWCSRGWCKIWVLVFAGHSSGVSCILQQVRATDKTRFRVNLSLGRSFIADNKFLGNVVWKYGGGTESRKTVFGYGGLLSPVVFQYGCPNNAPGLLWYGGKGARKHWEPLFKNRSVDSELYGLFDGSLAAESVPEELWMLRYHNVALEMIERVKDFRGSQQLLLTLALLERKKGLDEIRNLIVLSDSEFQASLLELEKYGLIDSEKNVTRFGNDVIRRGGKSKSIYKGKVSEDVNFYPATFLGFQREV